jgi:hypothetical protein
MYRSLFIACIVILCVPQSSRAEDVPLGIWSWSQDSISTPEARTKLLDFCRDQGVSHIDQHVSIRKQENRRALQNPDHFAKLIASAAKRSITVSALRGDKSMFFANKHEGRLEELAVLMEFNRRLPKNASLFGVKYDVEPYLTEEWKSGGQSREKVMSDYLHCLVKMRKLLDDQSSSLDFSVDVPFWWDKQELEMEFNGQRKPFVYHIQDHVDSVSLMSYRRDANSVKKLAEGELNYSHGRPESVSRNSVSVGLNFNRASGVEEKTTFAGHPISLYRETLTSLQETLSDVPAVRFIMLHDYKHLAANLREAND